jgi:2'-5' RNA ligase
VTPRLFVAADLDDPAREFIAEAIELLRAAGVEARFQPREKWHATLAFLGDTDERRLGDVAVALRSACAGCAPFCLNFDAVGAFPDASRPVVVWVGSSRPQPGYALCSSSVRAACERLEYRFKEEAVPHVTVCRLKRWKGALPSIVLSEPATLPVAELTLYESVVDGPTTRYAIRERLPLGSDPPHTA